MEKSIVRKRYKTPTPEMIIVPVGYKSDNEIGFVRDAFVRPAENWDEIRKHTESGNKKVAEEMEAAKDRTRNNCNLEDFYKKQYEKIFTEIKTYGGDPRKSIELQRIKYNMGI